MAKNKKNVSREIEASEGNRAINKFRIGDAVMMLIIVILCLTCVLPFINLAAKSISSNSAGAVQRSVPAPEGYHL